MLKKLVSYGLLSTISCLSINSFASNSEEVCRDYGGAIRVLRSLSDNRAIAGCQFTGEDNALIELETLTKEVTIPSTQPLQTTAAKKFTEHTPAKPWVPGTQPASEYCRQVGGTVITFVDSTGGQLGMCSFEDKSLIDTWTLIRGPEQHQKLNSALMPPAQTFRAICQKDAGPRLSITPSGVARLTQEGQDYFYTLKSFSWDGHLTGLVTGDGVAIAYQGSFGIIKDVNFQAIPSNGTSTYQEFSWEECTTF